MEREDVHPPFDRLRANGAGVEVGAHCPFVLSLSKHERRLLPSSHLGKLYSLDSFSEIWHFAPGLTLQLT